MKKASEPRRTRAAYAEGTWWCNSHQRVASYVWGEPEKRCCNPNLGGILAICAPVFAPMHLEPVTPRAPRCTPANGRCPDCRTPLVADGIAGNPARTYRKFLCTMCGLELQVDLIATATT